MLYIVCLRCERVGGWVCMQQVLKVWGLKHVLYIDCRRCDRVGGCACSSC